jgi:hypothetical protein
MKTDFRSWDSVQFRPLANIEHLFVNQIQKHQKITRVLIHRQLVAESYAFVVEYQNSWYFLMNAYDLDKITSSMPFVEAEAIRSSMFGVDVIEDTEEIKKVMCGVFVGGTQFDTMFA